MSRMSRHIEKNIFQIQIESCPNWSSHILRGWTYPDSPVSYYLNYLYNMWKSIKKCFKSVANLQSLFSGIVLACVQSGQKPGSFSQEMRFKLQQLKKKASNLWMKHTIYLPPYESEITFNHNILLSHSEFSHLSANKCYHTLAISSLNCRIQRVCECANSSLER